MSNSKKQFLLLILIVMLSKTLSAQISWDFGSASASGGAVPNITAGSVTQVNNNGSTTFIGSGSPSSTTYTGASGGNNGSVSAKTGSINTGTSSYVQVVLTPATNYSVSINSISWGNYSVSTSGPTTLSVYTSLDNYTTAIGTASATQNSTWALLSPTISSTTGKINEAITIRIYASGGSGGTPAAGTANWRIDDLKMSVKALSVSETVYMSMKYNSANAPSPWNNISTANTTVLLNSNGTTSGAGIEFLSTPWNAGDAGAVTGNNSGVYPDAVIKDYFWFGVYGAPETVNTDIKGLDPNGRYNITFFSSSAWTTLGNNGTTVFNINGVVKSLYVHNNSNTTITYAGIQPNGSGVIRFNMSKGSATPYGVLNAIVLEKLFDVDAFVKSWDYNGNTVAITKTLGTIDNFDLPIITNNTERMRVTAAGNVGIGTATPNATLQVKGITMADGKLGVGRNFTPAYPIEVDAVTTVENAPDQTMINVSNINTTFSLPRQEQSVDIQPTIGINNLYGLTWHDDGNGAGVGLVSNKKLIAYGVTYPNIKSFRFTAANNNLGNYSLDIMHTNASYSNPNNLWHQKPSSATIISWEHPLNLGTMSNFPLRFYADYGTPNKVADIFVHQSRVGIGTETPNVNAKLDVAGNIFTSGKIAIGTTGIDSDYQLFVEGKVRARKVRVDVDVWPDYVFDSSYKMPTLTELESFIQKNKHLPGITPAVEVEKAGIDIGDNQALLLKKIEELTLYIIEINKKTDALIRENAELKALKTANSSN